MTDFKSLQEQAADYEAANGPMLFEIRTNRMIESRLVAAMLSGIRDKSRRKPAYSLLDAGDRMSATYCSMGVYVDDGEPVGRMNATLLSVAAMRGLNAQAHHRTTTAAERYAWPEDGR
jgi:hypothetical protein